MAPDFAGLYFLLVNDDKNAIVDSSFHTHWAPFEGSFLFRGTSETEVGVPAGKIVRHTAVGVTEPEGSCLRRPCDTSLYPPHGDAVKPDPVAAARSDREHSSRQHTLTRRGAVKAGLAGRAAARTRPGDAGHLGAAQAPRPAAFALDRAGAFVLQHRARRAPASTGRPGGGHRRHQFEAL